MGVRVPGSVFRRWNEEVWNGREVQGGQRFPYRVEGEVGLITRRIEQAPTSARLISSNPPVTKTANIHVKEAVLVSCSFLHKNQRC